MALASLVKAVASRWGTQSLDSVVSGGLHSPQIPDGVEMPYAAFVLIDSSEDSRSSGDGESGSLYLADEFELWLYSTDGLQSAAMRADAVRHEFDHAPLVLDDGTLHYCRFVGESYQMVDDISGLCVWMLEFRVRRQQPFNRKPL